MTQQFDHQRLNTQMRVLYDVPKSASCSMGLDRFLHVLKEQIPCHRILLTFGSNPRALPVEVLFTEVSAV
ncbi:MAG: hypothetical protein KDB01_07360 [Planctomycetaceae bacterium]|nr:hypothetical protein [Planctomycetaceae bacterium]